MSAEIAAAYPMENAAPIQDTLKQFGSFAISCALTASMLAGGEALQATEAYAASSDQVAIGMPFTGKWAYNTLVNPDRYGNYSDSTSSHPSVHHRSYGDWATDLYANAGTPVVLHASSGDGAVSFTFNRFNDSCASSGANVAGHGVVLNVLVDNAVVGTVDYEHLDHIPNSPYTEGMTIGTITSEKLDPSCYSVRHTHVELKNTSQNTYACWVDQGKPGVTVAESAAIGRLGSSNTGAQQQCNSASSAPDTPFADGRFLRSTDTGAIYEMVGGAPIRLFNWGIIPSFRGQATEVNQASINTLPPYPRNGTFVNIAEAGGNGVYEFVGGAPIRQYNWGILNGFQGSAQDINYQSLASLDHMRPIPSDGSFVTIHEAGGNGIYEFVGGAPIRQFNWGALPGFGNPPDINYQSLQLLDHMNMTPSDGSFVNIQEAGGNGIYEFVGGAPLRLYNWGNLPTFRSNIPNINYTSLQLLDHMNAVPINGEFVAAVESGTVYRIAGGSALKLYNQGSIPDYQGALWLNQQTIDDHDHLAVMPVDGTILEGVSSLTFWQIRAGTRVQVTGAPQAVIVDEQTIANIPLA